MPNATARLGLPVIAPSQAQKHVTHNEALQLLDTAVQLVLSGVGSTTPPAVPAPGEIHALGPAPTGDWAGQAGKLAQWGDPGWIFVTPQEGWRGWDQTGAELLAYQGGGWSAVTPDLDNLGGVGIGTASDATNRLAVAADASLFSHAGTGHQMKINKAGTGDTASLLYQSNWTGHAEMGLSGDNDFHLKVSADGTSWTEALVVDAASGHVSGAAVQASATDTTPGRLASVDGALAAALGGFGGYYNSSAGVDIDLADAGFAGLVHDGNAGTWPLTPSGAFVLIKTQRLFSGHAVKQTAEYGYASSGAPSNLQRFERVRNNAGSQWSDWTVDYTGATVLGTVSQSGGVPTGAVIERGSNANGDYVRFADGTQICTYRSFPTDPSGIDNWTFPAAFSGLDQAVSATPQTLGDYRATIGNPTATSVALRTRDGSGALAGVDLGLMATGRWF